MLLVLHGLIQTCPLTIDGFTVCLVNLSRDGIRAGGFHTSHLLGSYMYILTSSLEGGLSTSWLIASCWSCSIVSSMIAAGRLGTLSKCSPHLSRICFLSVVLSALSRGSRRLGSVGCFQGIMELPRVMYVGIALHFSALLLPMKADFFDSLEGSFWCPWSGWWFFFQEGMNVAVVLVEPILVVSSSGPRTPRAAE